MVILRSIRWPRKELNKKKLYKRYEIKKLVLKSLLNNFYYKHNFKLYFSKLFYAFPINSSTSRYRTYCMLSCKVNLFSDFLNYLDIWWGIVQITVFWLVIENLLFKFNYDCYN
jgi:hypothetical protein